MELKVTRYEVDRGVAVITLNRPERLNAWTNRMGQEYRWGLATADADPGVRAIVVTGEGRGFCAGADARALDGMAVSGEYAGPDSSPLPPGQVPPELDHFLTFPWGLAKPVIAAVNGPAAGLGFVVMCFTDIRFAAEGAKLTTSFARLGLPAEHAISWALPRLVGTAWAAELLLSSRVVLAEEAADIGLVHRVLPPADLLPFTLEYARRMAAELSPASLRTIKRQLYGDLTANSLGQSATQSLALLQQMVAEPDFAEGVAAFRERRAPRFAP